jgi:hypothetical protein
MSYLIEILKKNLKKHKALYRRARLLRREYLARTWGYPDWNRLLGNHHTEWNAALNRSQEGPNVLIATSVGAYLAGVTLESVLGVALSLRGAKVHVFLCDSALPACFDCEVTWFPKQERFVEQGPSQDLCKSCFSPAYEMCRSLGFVIHRYSDFLTDANFRFSDEVTQSLPFSQIRDYQFEGIPVGEHALAGALRFYARASLKDEPHSEAVLRRYFKAALLTTLATRNLLKALRFDCITFHHGIYVPQGLIGEVARQEKVRVVNWNPAYRKRCFIFSHHDTYHHTLLSEPVEQWENMDWTPELEEKLLTYLESRWQGTEDWIWFHERPETDLNRVAKETGIDFSKTRVGLLTNVMWDAQLHYPANAFPNMLEWIIQTISYFSKRPELQLLIRVHPAEIRGTLESRQPITNEIRKFYQVLPKNVFVIPPESHASTYAVMSRCNAVLIYGTKTGIELASLGIPIVTAGEAWIRNKGISMDASSSEAYFKILDRLPLKSGLDQKTIERARRYAYHFFFRRMIPLEFMEPTGTHPPFRLRLRGLDELMPGRSKGLDLICNGILKGSEFIYP